MENYIKDKDLLTLVKNKSQIQQEAIAELIIGYITRYQFYVSVSDKAEAKLENLENVPRMYGNTKKLKKLLDEAWKFSEKDFTFHQRIRSTVFKEGTRNKLKLNWPLNKFTKMFLDEVMKDENQSTGEILAKAIKYFGVSETFLLAEFKKIFMAAKLSGQMLLRHKNVPDFDFTNQLVLYEVVSSAFEAD